MNIMPTNMILKDNDLFHVHTKRCGHAEDISDEAYIEKALGIGASGIWFTDHAPFPKDPFRQRMKYSQLNEYLHSLSELKKRYKAHINIHIGLEIEYFPTYDRSGYYKELVSDERIEILLLGQHMAEDATCPGKYTFDWDKGRLKDEEYVALGEAVCSGIRSRYFNAVAHPDRIFRRKKIWDEGMEKVSLNIISAAKTYNIPLEQNESSRRQKNHYWKEFWDLTDEKTEIIHGLDAHSLKDLKFSF